MAKIPCSPFLQMIVIDLNESSGAVDCLWSPITSTRYEYTRCVHPRHGQHRTRATCCMSFPSCSCARARCGSRMRTRLQVNPLLSTTKNNLLYSVRLEPPSSSISLRASILFFPRTSPEAVLPDRALCLPTFSHFPTVKKTSLSLSPPR